MFPFYNDSSCSTCETETLCTTINNVPVGRIESKQINTSLVTREQILGSKITDMRLFSKLTSSQLSELCNINPATISRYENAKFKIDLINLDNLQIISEACGYEKLYLFDDYLFFRLYHIDILESYIKCEQISRTKLAEQLCVSPQLVKTWFTNKKRCPSYQIWQTTFKEFSLNWVQKSFN